MQYIMMLTDMHYDLSFGAIAEAFSYATVKLKKVTPR